MFRYRSEIIRESIIRTLTEKVRRKNYGRYLLKMKIENLRVFREAEIEFEFPVTAIIGVNGSGKSTVLMASGCIYKDVKPSDFFASSSEDSISNAKVTYTLIDRDEKRDGEITRSISFIEKKWSRKKTFERAVKYFGIRRTVPPAELRELYKLRSRNIEPKQRIRLTYDEVRIINRILGFERNYEIADYPQLKKDLYIGSISINGESIRYSEFHFGAGESSIARMVHELENIPENSLVLIEEIENGLHPLAVMKFVEYLVDVARRRKIQIIFTTHSPYALELLPPQAVWYCSEGKIKQGKVPIETLRSLTGMIEPRLVVYVEDEFSKKLILALLRYKNMFDIIELIEICPAGGKNEVINFANNFNQNPAIQDKKAIGILDGDVEEEINEEYFIKLPGNNPPEMEVWNAVLEKINEEIAGLTKALGLDVYNQQEFVKNTIRKVDLEITDFHLVYAVLGEKLGYISEETVKDVFISSYVKLREKELERVTDFIRENIQL